MVSNTVITGGQKFTLSGLTPLVYIINSEIVFVVCPLRTIFGMKKGAHVHLTSWKHGNRDTGLNMACTHYAVAVVMVAMARTCTCNCQLRHGSAFLDVGITVRFF